MENTARSTASAASTGVISRRSDLPPDLLAAYEAHLAHKAAPNPLYETEKHTYGNFKADYTRPPHARAGNFSKFFLSRKGQMKSTLDCSTTKSKYPTR